MGIGCSRYSVILPCLIRISLINKTHIYAYTQYDSSRKPARNWPKYNKVSMQKLKKSVPRAVGEEEGPLLGALWELGAQDTA